MYIHIHICIYIYVCIHGIRAHTYISIFLCIRIYIMKMIEHTHACTHTHTKHTQTHTHTRTHKIYFDEYILYSLRSKKEKEKNLRFYFCNFRWCEWGSCYATRLHIEIDARRTHTYTSISTLQRSTFQSPTDLGRACG